MKSKNVGKSSFIGKIVAWMLLIMIEVIMATQWIPNCSQHTTSLLGWNEATQHTIEPPHAVGLLENYNNKTSFCILMTVFTAMAIHYNRQPKRQRNGMQKKALKTE